MIDQQFISDNPEVDWSVYKSQQTVPPKMAAAQTVYDMNQAQANQPQAGGSGNQDISSPGGGMWNSIKQIPGLAENAIEHPIDSVQDVGAGIMGGAQRLAAVMGEAGQGIASTLTGGRAPRVNIREELGLEGDNQVHLEDLLSSKNNNPLAKSIGQYGFGAASGGRSLIGQMGANAAWSGIQAKPGERVKDAAIGGLLAGAPALLKAPGAIKSGINYLQPGKTAEAFRSTLGEGTSAENIATLSKRAQLAKGSAQQEALIPKEKLYDQEGGSDVYNMPQSSLPEGNIPQVAHTIAPGEKYGQSQADALSKAITDFRKGKVDPEAGGRPLDTFLSKAEDIFNVGELPDKAAAKIEDMMSLPVARDSKYFSDSDVTSVYSPKGKLMDLHNAYEAKPTLDNYDSLQSALKKELRDMQGRAKVSDTAVPKVEQLQANIKNLNADKEGFMQTLPQDMQNLENEFRQKYRSYAQTYEKPAPGKRETGSSLTLRRLAEGRGHLVDDAAVVRLFSKPTAADKQAILDMGEGAAKNAIYAALQKVPMRDAEGMANTLLDLKRTKGFDNIINPEMEQWANNMLHHVKRAKTITGSLKTAGGALAGLPFGPVGSMVGAVAPHAPAIAKYLGKRFKK